MTTLPTVALVTSSPRRLMKTLIKNGSCVLAALRTDKTPLWHDRCRQYEKIYCDCRLFLGRVGGHVGATWRRMWLQIKPVIFVFIHNKLRRRWLFFIVCGIRGITWMRLKKIYIYFSPDWNKIPRGEIRGAWLRLSGSLWRCANNDS